MKQILPLIFCLCFFQVNAQTKIIDSKVDWSTGTITVYVADSLASSISVQLGTTFQSHDVFNETSLTVGDDLPISDVFVVPLANVSPGVYYVDVKVTSPGGIRQMEYQTSE